MFQRLKRLDTKLVYTYSLLIGLCTGFAAIGFYYCLSGALHLTYDWLMHLPMHHAHGEVSFFEPLAGPSRKWIFFFLPVVGGLIAGLIIYFFGPEAEGTGTDSFLDCFHNKAGVMRRRLLWVKPIATIFTLASGGSAGKEGPVIQIGASIGSVLSQWVGAGARARRTFLLAGAAGGLGAIFRAPLGGALTAVEVLYHEDLETDALIPCLLSSVMAYTVFGSFLGFGHIFQVNLTISQNFTELLMYVLLGLICSAVGYGYIRFFHGIKTHIFDKLPIKQFYKPALGGIVVGCIGYFFPDLTGLSMGFIQSTLNGHFTGDWTVIAQSFLVFCILKIVSTTFTIQSGGSGGVFAPSLFVGGMLGGFVGTVAQHYFPNAIPDVVPFIIVGMGAFFAGVVKAPIASMIMVSELTGSYDLLPPLIIVAVTSIILSHRQSLYSNQMINKFFSKAHLWEMNPNILQKVLIQDAFANHYPKQSIILNSSTYDEVEQIASRTNETDFLVTNHEDSLVGVFSFKDLYFEKNIDDIKPLLVVGDLAMNCSIMLTPRNNLFEAFERLMELSTDKIPVVDSLHTKKLLGYIRQKDIFRVYKKRIELDNDPIEISQTII